MLASIVGNNQCAVVSLPGKVGETLLLILLITLLLSVRLSYRLGLVRVDGRNTRIVLIIVHKCYILKCIALEVGGER